MRENWASLFFGIITALLMISGHHSNATPIYGVDNRKDLYEVNRADHLQWADSVLGLYERSNLSSLKEQPGKIKIKSRIYAKSEFLCPGTRFEKQHESAFCSGALIGRDVIVTAGHCVSADHSCDSTAFVFGNSKKTDTEANSEIVVSESDVYYCKKILTYKGPTSLGNADKNNDYAIVQLNRVVSSHKILEIDFKDIYAVETPVVTIGHPHGLPLKVTDGGFIARSVSEESYFSTDLDVYTGNSGSPIFNDLTGKIIGLVARGDVDMTLNYKGKCADNMIFPEHQAWNDNPKVYGEQMTKSKKFEIDFNKWSSLGSGW